MMICLDTNCVIYLVEKNPLWAPKIVARLAKATAAGDTIGVSDFARTECLIGPLKCGDAALLADYHTFFSNPAVKGLSLTRIVCDKAAEVRVASSMAIKIPDALHLAAAIVHGCGLFLTNDAQLTKCGGIAVEILT